jgi:hypothetical protein
VTSQSHFAFVWKRRVKKKPFERLFNCSRLGIRSVGRVGLEVVGRNKKWFKAEIKDKRNTKKNLQRHKKQHKKRIEKETQNCIVRKAKSRLKNLTKFLCYESLCVRSRSGSGSAMSNRQIYSNSCFKQVKFKVKSAPSSAQLWSAVRENKRAKWSERINNSISAMCKLFVMILILLTLLCNYLMIVFYKCLWVFSPPRPPHPSLNPSSARNRSRSVFIFPAIRNASKCAHIDSSASRTCVRPDRIVQWENHYEDNKSSGNDSWRETRLSSAAALIVGITNENRFQKRVASQFISS